MMHEFRALDRITQCAMNEHGSVEVSNAKSILNKYGWRQPIVVNTEGAIIAGHVRYQAAVELGWANA